MKASYRERSAMPGRLVAAVFRNTYVQKRKKLIRCMLCCAVCFGLTGQLQLCRAAVTQASAKEAVQEEKQGVTFSELNAKEVFLKQSQARVCTLTASTMMIRRAAMLSGNENWKQITEQSARKSAWSEGTGLKWDFKVSGISVTHKQLASSKELVTLLNSHPEGVVIYNSRKPHAILITDYTDGIFYCSDPSKDTPSGRYPVSQASITVASATRCWYVKQPQGLTVIEDDADDLSDNTADGMTYQILDKEEKTAACTGVLSESTSVSIPDTVRIDGVEYKVTKIAESAFANNEKLKEITIGANVTDIAKKAFYQCKKLKKITINARMLKEIGADAFAQIHNSAQLLIDGVQIETFAALLTGTAVPQTATVTACSRSSS